MCWLCSFSLVGLCVSFEPSNLFDLFCFLACVLLVVTVYSVLSVFLALYVLCVAFGLVRLVVLDSVIVVLVLFDFFVWLCVL